MNANECQGKAHAMKLLRSGIAALIVLGVVMLIVSPAQAASPTTVTEKSIVITEDQINASYWVTHPVRRSATNKHVTLGDGTVTIDAIITHRDGKSFKAETIWKPYVTSTGVLVFGFQSATVNELAASTSDHSELVLAHRFIVRNAIRNYVRSQVGGPFRYTGITVVPGQLTITVNVYSR
jgi:hypothetical protein